MKVAAGSSSVARKMPAAASAGILSWIVSGIAAWLGWTVPLLAAEWWLERDRSRGRRGASAGAPDRPVPETHGDVSVAAGRVPAAPTLDRG